MILKVNVIIQYTKHSHLPPEVFWIHRNREIFKLSSIWAGKIRQLNFSHLSGLSTISSWLYIVVSSLIISYFHYPKTLSSMSSSISDDHPWSASSSSAQRGAVLQCPSTTAFLSSPPLLQSRHWSLHCLDTSTSVPPPLRVTLYQCLHLISDCDQHNVTHRGLPPSQLGWQQQSVAAAPGQQRFYYIFSIKILLVIGVIEDHSYM